MAYIKLEDLQKFPIRLDHYDKENGNEHFILGIETVIDYAENLPTADVEEVRHGKRIEQLCDDKNLKFIVLMARNGKTHFPEFKELEEIIEELPLRERVIAREHYLKGLKIPELVKSYGYSERQVLRIIASAKELMRRSDT